MTLYADQNVDKTIKIYRGIQKKNLSDLVGVILCLI